jgi:hypothetical protein
MDEDDFRAKDYDDDFNEDYDDDPYDEDEDDGHCSCYLCEQEKP